VGAIFIGGCERSGTTLLGNMLGSHSDCVHLPEAPFLPELIFLRKGYGLSWREVRSQLLRDPRFSLWRVTLDEDWIAESCDVGEAIESLVELYCRKKRRSARYWVDHTPGNIEYWWRLSKVIDGSKFIHLIRDGRAVAASIKKLPDWPFASVRSIARHWLRRIGFGLAAESAMGNVIVRVKYEDLVANPERELKRLCGWLGIGFEKEMVERKYAELSPYTIEQHKLVLGNIDTSRIAAWKVELISKEMLAFESEAGEMLAHIGYKLEYEYSRKRLGLFGNAVLCLVEVVKGLISALRRRRRMRASIGSSKMRRGSIKRLFVID